MMTARRWDDALPTACALLTDSIQAELLGQTRIVRDLFGRLAVIVPDELPDETIAALRSRLASALGRYAAPKSVLVSRYSETLDPEGLRQDPRAYPSATHAAIRILDRVASGGEWLLAPGPSSALKRATFYSVKGGVGRSTAAAVAAWRLAQEGFKILVLDLDLEAPGIGSLLLAEDRLPPHGIVDWLVEDALGGVDDVFLRDMIGRSHLVGGNGELAAVPAYGEQSLKAPHDYLAKLSRAFVELPRDGRREGFSARIDRLVSGLEHSEQPDLIVIDSRAGLHEIAATTLLRLGADAFLFATDTRQTWADYRFLLVHLKRFPTSVGLDDDDWRRRLKMVHALALPDLDSQRRFVDSSYRLWSETLYEEEGPDTFAAFNYDLNDETAPHHALRVLMEPLLRPIELSDGISSDLDRLLAGAFGNFVAGIREQLGLGRPDSR